MGDAVPVTATILFTDLVGSTELLSNLGDARYDEVRRGHLELVSSMIDTHGGEVVKNLGDGVMGAFTSATTAAQAAIAMQVAVEQHGRRPGASTLGVRVGLSAGDCTHEDADYFGTVVVEAARLCAAADGGQILAAEIVRHLVGTTADLSFGPTVPLMLKGLSEPLATVELAWIPRTPPLPEPLLSLDAAGEAFVGRRDELAVLADAAREATAGACRAVFVGGETGMGKSRLAARFAADRQREGSAVLFGRADSEVVTPLGLAAQVLVGASSLVDGRDLEQHRARFGGALNALVPALDAGEDGGRDGALVESELERHRLFRAGGDLITRAAHHHPLVIVLDDLHWADDASVLFFRSLIVDSRPPATVLLATYRDNDVRPAGSLANFLTDALREPWAQRLTVTGLDGRSVADYLHHSTGALPAGRTLSLASVIRDRTQGNPLFVCEVIRQLIDAGVTVDELGQIQLPGDDPDLLGETLPSSLLELVERRVGLLGTHAAELLRVAALVGPEVEVGLLAAVTDASIDDVLSVVDDAARARLVVWHPGGLDRCAFPSPVMREALRAGLTPAQQVGWHRRIAQALELRVPPPVASLAYHYSASIALGGADRALVFAERAAEEAMAVLAVEQAAVHYEQAVDALARSSPVDHDQECHLLRRWATARDLAGDTAGAREQWRRAAALADAIGDHPALVEAARGIGGSFNPYGSLAHDTEKEALLVRALEVTDEPSTRAGLLADLAVVRYRSGDSSTVGEWRPLIDEATDLVDGASDPVARAEVLVRRYPLVHGPDTLDDRRAVADEILAIAEVTGDDELGLQGWAWTLVGALEAGDVARWRAAAERRDALTEQLPHPAFRWTRALHDAFVATLEGRLLEAERLAWLALAAGQRVVGEDAVRFFAIQMFRSRQFRGSMEELLDPAEAYWTLHPEYVAAGALVVQGRLAVGRRDDARALLLDLAPDIEGWRRDFDWYPALCHVGFAAVSLGELEVAETVRRLLLPYRGRNATSAEAVLWASVDHLVGAMGAALDDPAADEELDDAINAYDAMGARPYAAVARNDRGQLLARRGDRQAADALISEAREVGAELGLSSLLATLREQAPGR